MHAIQVDHVVKRYKNGVQALNGLSLSVKEGEIFSLLGQNGAGKSTLIRILTTYLCLTAGEIEMMGKDIKKMPQLSVLKLLVSHNKLLLIHIFP